MVDLREIVHPFQSHPFFLRELAYLGQWEWAHPLPEGCNLRRMGEEEARKRGIKGFKPERFLRMRDIFKTELQGVPLWPIYLLSRTLAHGLRVHQPSTEDIVRVGDHYHPLLDEITLEQFRLPYPVYYVEFPTDIRRDSEEVCRDSLLSAGKSPPATIIAPDWVALASCEDVPILATVHFPTDNLAFTPLNLAHTPLREQCSRWWDGLEEGGTIEEVVCRGFASTFTLITFSLVLAFTRYGEQKAAYRHRDHERHKHLAKKRPEAFWHLPRLDPIRLQFRQEIRADLPLPPAHTSYPSQPTGETKSYHVRRGHWHSFWTGPKVGDRKLIRKFIEATEINPHLKLECQEGGETIIRPKTI